MASAITNYPLLLYSSSHRTSNGEYREEPESRLLVVIRQTGFAKIEIVSKL